MLLNQGEYNHLFLLFIENILNAEAWCESHASKNQQIYLVRLKRI